MNNPYESPEHPGAAPAAEWVPGEPFWPAARGVFLAWERLRLVYNGLLVVWTTLAGFALGGELFITSIEFWGTAIFGAVVVNLCYFAGPLIETYLLWLGYRASAVRLPLFILGTLFTSGLAFAGLVSQVNIVPGMV